MRTFWLLLLQLLLISCAAGVPRHASLEKGAVASPERTATAVGSAILAKNGNAVDAAIAVAFALAVTYPAAGNLGGGGFMLVHEEKTGADTAVDYRESAPAAAVRDMFLDRNGNVIVGESLSTHKAAGVPGTVAGLWLAHQKWGSLPWADLIAPAVTLAEGWTVDAVTARGLAAESKRAGVNPAFKKIFGAGAARLVQTDLAATLRRIAAKGRDGFYKGETAALIAAEMKRGNGLITEADLAAYEAKVRRPVAGEYRGHRVVSMPPPSSGGAILIQMLNMLEGHDVAKLSHNSAAYIHLVAEIEKRAFADRSVWLGDSDFFDVPLDELTSKPYAQKRIADFSSSRRSNPPAIGSGSLRREKVQTTHFSIIDKWGNAVSNTYTLNGAFGSRIVVEGAGFILNNEMDDFSLKPGVPNRYGVIGGEANAIAAGKRMLSSMSPTFVYDKAGKLWLAVGTPGGPMIFTTVFQVIVNRIDFSMPLDKSIAAPRFHHQWPPPAKDRDIIDIESLDRKVIDLLESLGYAFRKWHISDVHAVEIDRAAGRAFGVSDPRGIGKSE